MSIGAGDLIQTRKNYSDLGMANRQQWIVQRVTDDGTVYAREVSSAGKRLRAVALPAEYVSEWAHLSYAATAYGVQGATVDSSHTVLSEATSAAGIYVGMTRGREQNRLHIIAETMADARAQFIEAMERDPANRGLDHATTQAIDAVRGLVADARATRHRRTRTTHHRSGTSRTSSATVAADRSEARCPTRRAQGRGRRTSRHTPPR
ncbi:MAG: hypothetical protein QM695_07750 [Micropruina sp.]